MRLKITPLRKMLIDMKKVLILGAGNGQIPFIDKCRKKGCKVIVASKAGNYPGFNMADKAYYIDTTDKDGICEIAKKEDVDLIITDQTDVSVPTIAYVSEKLGLPGIGYNRAIIYTDKYVMRCAAKECGIPVPMFFKVSSVEEAYRISTQMSFPLISKPIDSSGSRGVHRIESYKDFNEKVEDSIKMSNMKTAILEEFIIGKEYLVDGFALNGGVKMNTL